MAGLGKFYDGQAGRALGLLGLKKIEARRGFAVRCGFPVNLKEKYLGRVLGLGFSVHVVREEGGWLSGVKRRTLAEMWIATPKQ